MGPNCRRTPISCGSTDLEAPRHECPKFLVRIPGPGFRLECDLHGLVIDEPPTPPLDLTGLIVCTR